MPHRGQETVIRVLRLWCWRDIPRRTPRDPRCILTARATSREPIAFLWSAPRSTRDEGDRTRRLCSGADVGSSTIGAELIHGFLKFPRHHLQSAQAPQHARTGFAAIPFATKSGVEPTTAGMLRLLGEELQLSAPPALPTPLRLPGRVHDQLM
jgi:hypothetical protein